MVKVVIPLGPASRAAFDRLAARELRDPRMQAKLMLERALREQGHCP